MAENTMVRQGSEGEEARPGTTPKPKPPTWSTTLVQGEVTKIERDSKAGVGICRIHVVEEAPGPASSPPGTVLYIRDGGEPDAGYVLRADESRRCNDGLGVGDVIRVEGRVAVSRQKARAQEVIVTEPVKLMWDASEQDPDGVQAGEVVQPARPARLPSPSRPTITRRPPAGSALSRSGGTRHDRPRVVLFSGPNDWTDRARVRRDLEGLPAGSVVIGGGTRGDFDRIVREEAPRHGVHVASMPPLWEYFDKSAGYRRNEASMLMQPEESFIYSPAESPGTRHMSDVAEAASVPVREG
jgi:hypothetical protein